MVGRAVLSALAASLLTGCAPTGEPGSSRAKADASSGDELDYDAFFAWGSEAAHAIAGDIDVEGDWSELRLPSRRVGRSPVSAALPLGPMTAGSPGV